MSACLCVCVCVADVAQLLSLDSGIRRLPKDSLGTDAWGMGHGACGIFIIYMHA